ncbi:adenosylcobinamide-GDP ribazoletransferase [Vibrio sp. WJH972]
MPQLKYQWELFLLALSFFSRIPVAMNLPYSPERMNQSGRYFPLVGAVIALVCYVFFLGLTTILPVNISLFYMMVVSVLVTGAFHEDGLADMADGIGGGMTVDKRLTIMKDSRIGTYGAVSLVLVLLGKFLLLSSILESNTISFIIVLGCGYISSRAIAATLIYNTPYVSELDLSKSKPLAQSQSLGELIAIVLTGVIPLAFLPFKVMLLIALLLLVSRFLLKRWLILRLGGFTGDCLGAFQQISELLIYTCLIACYQVQWL